MMKNFPWVNILFNCIPKIFNGVKVTVLLENAHGEHGAEYDACFYA